MTTGPAEFSRRTLIKYAATLGAGVAVGAVTVGSVRINPSALAQSTQVADPTATREAELAELHALQTQVAQPAVCTPAVSPTADSATATPVPASATGVPLSYRDKWTITVVGIVPVPGSDTVRPAGNFMQVSMVLSHSQTSIQFVPYTDFMLSDGAGRYSAVDQGVNRGLLGNDWLLGVQPGEARDWSLIFDVAADAGDSFLLESKADPMFRVAMTVEQRG
jgi:hypothetical protein